MRHWVFVVLIFCECAGLPNRESSSPLSESYRQYRRHHNLLYIHNFDNRTYAPQLTGRLKEKVQRAFLRHRSLVVTTEKEKAELFLTGTIHHYSEEIAIYDRIAGPKSFNLEIIASFRIRARTTNGSEAPAEEHTVRFMTNYSLAEPFFESRFVAEERLLEGLAERMVDLAWTPENT